MEVGHGADPSSDFARIDQSLVDHPAAVATLAAAETFELSPCSNWTADPSTMAPVTRFIVALAAAAAAHARAPPAQPNVLIMLTDDQGWGDNEYNCGNSTCAENAGHCCPHTPHLAAFAKDPHTALFHRFYAAASVCSPTRGALASSAALPGTIVAAAL